jgi:hypothetical protein
MEHVFGEIKGNAFRYGLPDCPLAVLPIAGRKPILLERICLRHWP